MDQVWIRVTNWTSYLHSDYLGLGVSLIMFYLILKHGGLWRGIFFSRATRGGHSKSLLLFEIPKILVTAMMRLIDWYPKERSRREKYLLRDWSHMTIINFVLNTGGRAWRWRKNYLCIDVDRGVYRIMYIWHRAELEFVGVTKIDARDSDCSRFSDELGAVQCQVSPCLPTHQWGTIK